MDFEDLVVELAPPPNRVRKCDGERERHLLEGAVMVAFAMHLLRSTPTREVIVHPDGEHGKRFDFASWLARRGFERKSSTGRTGYAGRYVLVDGRCIVVNPKSGEGDVVAEVDGVITWAECKGGIINTRHPGQVSRLYRGLCETVGLLMANPSPGRQVAVVPGIEIALVGSRGEVEDVRG
jgi:hypothetical protein